MKKIVVFFDAPNPMDHPLSTPDYWTSYSELTDVVKAQGGELFIARGQGSYLGSGNFSNSWKIEHNELRQKGKIKADVIFDKGRFQSDDKVPIFNSAGVRDICVNKWKMYQLLSEFCPLTFFVEDVEQLHAAIPGLKTERIVFKPFSGAEGVGVKIENKNYFDTPSDQLQFPAIISEFLDTSVGIPGIMEGLHDLRLAIFDGEVLYSYFRTPPQNSFLANVSKGGRFEMIDPKRLPHEVITIAKQIDSRLSEYGHRFYSVDFGYTKEGPKIIEMNSELGLLPNKDHAVFITLKEKLASAFMDM